MPAITGFSIGGVAGTGFATGGQIINFALPDIWSITAGPSGATINSYPSPPAAPVIDATANPPSVIG